MPFKYWSNDWGNIPSNDPCFQQVLTTNIIYIVHITNRAYIDKMRYNYYGILSDFSWALPACNQVWWLTMDFFNVLPFYWNTKYQRISPSEHNSCTVNQLNEIQMPTPVSINGNRSTLLDCPFARIFAFTHFRYHWFYFHIFHNVHIDGYNKVPRDEITVEKVSK